ncbi:chaperone modulator CbpM [Dyadobacter sandarakinus]|uniref:Chaperone modulator CbpM n=1 Tax=Dyadobacter sandarakinus TaxID=2747268 RepID=A0ABX7I4L2_9BACT|nr:chaperone modulator CbpM [Dyadobacter sandarakinus]QRR00875.1 chaperone modulator CbpM [Dyadobacter sandarakinus]
MENDELISIETFCTYYGVEHDFVDSLQESGLIELVVMQQTRFLHVPHLERIERMVRLHNDLHINMEGIGAIHTLLERMDDMNREITALRNRLRLYE